MYEGADKSIQDSAGRIHHYLKYENTEKNEMKIIIEPTPPDGEDIIILRSSAPNPRLISMLLSLQTAKTELNGYLDDRMVRISVKDVYYFEANENRVFAYCEHEVYEIKRKLYELESDFADMDFVRCSKSLIVNMEKIDCLSPLFNGRMEARLDNGERIVISRQYVHILREKLGGWEEN